ncbi:MAG: prepilin peptidase [bacterium]|nr:prepilin peptidase [bacterium]
MILLGIFFFLIGLAVGSFLNVIIYRLPKGISIIKPPSHCPSCGTRIKFYDNIPLISFIILRGKCRYCGSKISPIYPVVEGLTGFAFLLVYLKFNFNIFIAIKFMIFTALLITISFIDLKEKVIFDSLTIPWIGIGLISTLFLKDIPFLNVFLTAVISGFLFWILRITFSKILKREAMGEGDILLIMLISSFTGFKGAYFSMLLGSIFALLAHIIFPNKIKDEIPFGPFLSLGAFIGIFTL